MALDRVRDPEGTPLWAHFEVLSEPASASDLAVFLESRGGARGGRNERNPDYERALRLILRRLAALGATLQDATVESTVTRSLDHERKAIRPGRAYPIDLAATDTEALRLALQRSQRTIGQSADATGSGNNTKRMRLRVRLPGPSSPSSLQEALAFGISDEHLAANDSAAVVAGKRGGQGYATDSVALRAIEKHAMAVVRARLVADGWTQIQDTSSSKPYDFECTKAGGLLRVEVKGTRGVEPSVFLTKNEVDHARSGARVAIAIVTGIGLNRVNGVPRPAGGTVMWIEPWDVDKGKLEETQFRWRPRPDEAP